MARWGLSIAAAALVAGAALTVPPAPGQGSVLVIGYVAVRSAAIEFGTSQASASTTGSAQVLSAVTATLVPLALALIAVAIAVLSVMRRQWQAAAGAVLLAGAALIWIDGAIGAVRMPYQVRDYAAMFSPDLLTPTAALPQPGQAVTAALRLAAAILIIAGIARRGPAARRPDHP
jgi:hypothetical protein